MKKWLLLIIVHCSFNIIHCYAQQQNHFKHYTTENGLSQSSIFSIVQDNIGFVWFATEDGLNKFDGKKFTVFRPVQDDSTSLIDLGIRKVYKDKSGKLWVLSLRGSICRYDPVKNNFKRFQLNAANSDSKVKIITIAEDSGNNLLAITSKGELFIYNSQKEQFIFEPLSKKFRDQLSSLHIQCLLGASDGTFWIGTWEGMIHANLITEEFRLYNSSGKNNDAISGDMVFNLAEDKLGNIWAVSANGGLSVYIKSQNKIKVFKYNPLDKNSISSNRLMCLLIDKREKIWIGTFDKGLILFDPVNESFTNMLHNPSVVSSLSIGAVMSIYEDRSGGLWFGTGGGGVNHFDPLNQNFTHYQHIPGNQNSISPNPVLSICEDSEGNLYVGSDGGGLNIREKNSSIFKSFFQNPEYGSNAITAIYEDSKGNIWIGSDPGSDSPAGALIKYNRKTKKFTHIRDINIKLGGISAILEDKFGELWITTPSDGLHRYNPNTGIEIEYRYNPEDSWGINSNSLFCICEDSYGNLWFGSIASGLLLFDRKTDSFKRFVNDPSDKRSIGSDAVWCITEDKNRNIWIGTWGGGVNKFNQADKTFTRYTVDDGLPGNVVYGIIPDNKGNIWISSNKGLSEYNPTSGMIKNFDVSNGLLINDFSAGALFKTKEGKFYFGGNSGLISFYPESINENTYIPKVVITDFLVFDKPLSLKKSILFTDNINLDYDQNFFTIEFASLDFAAPEKNKFEYMLEGVDKHWVISEGRNFASYTDLNNGHYRFKLKGSNSGGKFTGNEIVLSIIIAPPYWKTWWFRIILVSLMILMLYAAHRYSLNKLLEVERTRNGIARDLHDEVSASITGIVYFTEAVKTEIKGKETPTLKKLIGLISESAAQIQESMSDIIWSINPENDNWKVVLPKFRRYVSDLCESKGIKYDIEMPESFSGKSLKMEQRHNLWLVLKEILTNAVRHSFCSQIRIKLFTDSNYLHLIFFDNGIGFDDKIESPNNGLKNIRTRCKALDAASELITSKGNGTQWKIKIPLTLTISK